MLSEIPGHCSAEYEFIIVKKYKHNNSELLYIILKKI